MCTFSDPVGLSNELSCKAGTLFCCCNTYRFLQPEVLKLYFPAQDPWVSCLSCSQVVPPGLSAHECGITQSTSCCLTWPGLSSCCGSSLPLLPVSAPPTSLDECFFFNSLVVGLLYSLIFWQYWFGFLFLNCLLSFFWLCKEAKYIYLCLHIG